MSQKRNKIIVLIGAIIIVGILIFVYAHKSHIIILNSSAFSDNFKGYGAVRGGDHVVIKVPLDLINSKYPLQTNDVLCFTTDPILSDTKMVYPNGADVSSERLCLRSDLVRVGNTISIEGNIPRDYSSKLGENDVILSIWKKGLDDDLSQKFDQYYYIDEKGQKVYLKDLPGIERTIPIGLKIIVLFSIK